MLNNFFKAYLNHITSSNMVLPIVFIVIFSMVILSSFGPNIFEENILNTTAWLSLGLIPTFVLFLGRFVILYIHKETFVNIAIVYTVGFLCLLTTIYIISPDIINQNIDSVIFIYALVIIPSEFTGTVIQRIEDKYKDNISNNKKDTDNQKKSSNIVAPILLNIPFPQRGELWALKADDHYVNIVTSKGTILHYSTLTKAIEETMPIKGIKIHRSFWVAEKGIINIKKKNGKYICILKDGSEMPVSKSGAAELKNRKWIK